MGFLDHLRKTMNPDIFQPPMGNDLPSQGGFAGQFPQNSPLDMNMSGLSMPGIFDPTPVSANDPDGGTLPDNPQVPGALPSTNPSAGLTQPSQAPFIDPSVVNPRGDIGDVPVADESPDDFIKRRMMELYNPEHTASDSLTKMIGAYPKRTPPSFMQKLAASLYGLGEGPKGADQILDGDYNQKVADWKNQIAPTEQAATLERYMNTNQRSFANQEVQRELQNKDLERKTAKDKATEDYQQGSLKARQARTAFMYYKQQHPNHIYKQDSEGYVYSIDPQTDQPNYIEDGNGDLVKGDKLPEQERIQLQHQNKVGEIQATGDQRVREIDESGNQTRQTNANKPPTGANNSNKPLSAREIAGQRKNRVADLVAQDPENSKYIKTDPNTGAIMLQAPGGMFSTPTQAQLDHVKALRDYIYGPEVGQPSASHQQTPMNQNPLAQGQLPPPEKRVVGKTYTMGNGKPGIWMGNGFKPAGAQ